MDREPQANSAGGQVRTWLLHAMSTAAERAILPASRIKVWVLYGTLLMVVVVGLGAVAYLPDHYSCERAQNQRAAFLALATQEEETGQRNAARAKTEGGALAKIDHGALASHAATAKALRQVPAEDCDTLFPAAGSLK